MADLWPWIAVAGLGALHGLSPATGWMFAAAWGVHTGKVAQVRHALLPIAIGHTASVAAVACAFAQGMSLNRAWAQGLAGALLLGAAACRLRRGAAHSQPIGVRAGHAGIAAWSFLMATAHGTGLMLVPALALCVANGRAREISVSGSLLLALAAVGVHTAAMLATTGVVAAGVCRGLATHPRLLSGPAAQRGWTAALAISGLLLIVLR
ncbi:MAG TPA: hypothetical protein VGE16_10040 [Albitalea sp.]